MELGGSSWNANTQTVLDQAADFLCEMKERECKSYAQDNLQLVIYFLLSQRPSNFKIS